MSEPVTDKDLHIVWLDAAKRTRQQTEREIVAWLSNWIDDTMGRDIDPTYLITIIERGKYRK